MGNSIDRFACVLALVSLALAIDAGLAKAGPPLCGDLDSSTPKEGVFSGDPSGPSGPDEQSRRSGSGVDPSSINRTGRSFFQEGCQLYEQGLYAQATDRFLVSLGQEPRAETYRYLGECFDVLGRPTLASIHLARYVRQVPTDGHAWNRLGCVQLKCERYDEALASFGQLTRLNQEMGRRGTRSALVQQGQSLIRAGRFRQAEQSFTAALEIEGFDSEAREGVRQSMSGFSNDQGPVR